MEKNMENDMNTEVIGWFIMHIRTTVNTRFSKGPLLRVDIGVPVVV